MKLSNFISIIFETSRIFRLDDACIDISPNCAHNAIDCDTNPYVQARCKKTCNLCTNDSEPYYCADISLNCAYNAIYCNTNTYVQERCKKTCNLCKNGSPTGLTEAFVISPISSSDYSSHAEETFSTSSSYSETSSYDEFTTSISLLPTMRNSAFDNPSRGSLTSSFYISSYISFPVSSSSISTYSFGGSSPRSTSVSTSSTASYSTAASNLTSESNSNSTYWSTPAPNPTSTSSSSSSSSPSSSSCSSSSSSSCVISSPLFTSSLSLALVSSAATSSSFITTSKASPNNTCEGSEGWRGKCFGTEEDLSAYTRCDLVIKNANGCEERQSCCVDCSLLTDLCENKWTGSVARNTYNSTFPCPRYECKMGEAHPGSGCYCCKKCKPKQECKDKHGRCISDEDPVKNRDWCLAKGGTIEEDWCHGEGCHCCIWKIIASEESN